MGLGGLRKVQELRVSDVGTALGAGRWGGGSAQTLEHQPALRGRGEVSASVRSQGLEGLGRFRERPPPPASSSSDSRDSRDSSSSPRGSKKRSGASMGPASRQPRVRPGDM